jgi:cell division protein FtsL
MMGSSKNVFKTTLKEMGRPDKMIVFNVLIIVMVLVCAILVLSLRELERPILRVFLNSLSELDSV